MRIGINTRFLLAHKMEGFGWFTYEVCKRMVLTNPQHEFYFFFDRPFNKKFVFADNVTPITLQPQARRPILFKIWFNYSVTQALKRHKIDLFFSPDGYLSLKTDIPQIGVIHDLNFEHYPKDLPNWASRYLKKYTPKFARKAQRIITVSNYSKKDIIDRYGINPHKIVVAYNGANEIFKPINETTKAVIREKYTESQPYFLFVGALHKRKNLERLLMAFDRFKTRTYSKTKLLIVGEELWRKDEIREAIQGLEYKNEIKFTGHLQLEELAKITASAKAMTFVSYFEGFGIPILEAMKCGTPILAGNLTALPEVAGEAALFCDPFNIADISEKLAVIDKDIALRKKLSEQGLKRGLEFSWDKTTTVIWQEISRVLTS